ncbi:polysaccharide deacetylase family protein [Paenibacillus sp. LHD-117]|uniref:polysaccharide deacetylase family protein n=1 Tax=Paenibacillus sp. LHD-117 TaxID=3071412 RepID=UPI0027DFFE5C|nr:polysaccharide deacetylase family protein [Paenibacillus sp. LHD-117]MDQ6418265.1 polysaccharide deacetylase family protein [Paenibacillus sp. LHD-117]
MKKPQKTWQLAFVLLLSIQLTGCGSGSESLPASAEPQITTSTTIAKETQQPSPNPAIPSSDATATPMPSAASKPGESGVNAPKYRMNAKTFRFEPISDKATDKAVLLTFDDGPKDEGVLASLLDTLDRHGAKAIFFVNGYRVKQNPELLKEIHARGQTIGNHSYDHIDLKKETDAVVEEQLAKVQEDVERLTGVIPRFFRPPYGSGSEVVRQTAKNHGMLYMTWSNGSLDWDKSAKDKPDVVIRNVLDQLHPGANILMHELQWTADALDELLSKLEKEGYTFIDPGSIELANRVTN